MNFDKYKNNLTCPSEKTYKTYKIITVDETYDNLSYEDYCKLKVHLTKNNIQFLVVKDVSFDDKGYDKALVAYITEEQRIEQEFIADLKSYYGTFDLFNNAEELFRLTYNKACLDNHSDGYSSIASAYGDLYDFAYDILQCVTKV